MSRARYQESLVSVTGQALSNASVSVYEPNTTTPIAATMYADDTGGTTLSNPLTADARGMVRFYLATAQRVDFGITAAGMSPLTVEDSIVQDDPANVAHKTGVETLTQKTLSSPILDSPQINSPTFSGGAWTGADLTDPLVRNSVAVKDTAGTNTAVDVQASSGASRIMRIRPLGATQPGLRVEDYQGNDPIEFVRLEDASAPGTFLHQLKFGGNSRINMSTDVGYVRDTNIFGMHRTDGHQGRVAMELLYQNTYSPPTDSGPDAGDVATGAFMFWQPSGHSYARTLEMDMLAMSGPAGGFTKWPHGVIEASIQASYAGNGEDSTFGIHIFNMGGLWGIPTPQTVDTALLIGNDNYPFTNGIHYRAPQSPPGTAGALLFKVLGTGAMSSGDHLPVTDSAKDLGSLSLNWRGAYVDQYVSTAGISSSLVHYGVGAGNDGMGLPASHAIGFWNNNVETIRIDSDGLLDFMNPSSVHFASTGAGAAATLGNTINSGGGAFTLTTQWGWLFFRIAGGGPYKLPVWI